ncbi:MAG: hypothetical protein V7703_10285 [Hyphomicrobiales bacterium]
MSKPYWRSAIFRNWLVALLILVALIGAPLAASSLPSDRLMGLPSTLVFFAIGMPVIFLILAIFKISMQQALDRNYELDSEDQLQRRRVPKRLKSFPVKAFDVPDPDTPAPESAQSDSDTQQQRSMTGIDQTNRTQVAG